MNQEENHQVRLGLLGTNYLSEAPLSEELRSLIPEKKALEICYADAKEQNITLFRNAGGLAALNMDIPANERQIIFNALNEFFMNTQIPPNLRIIHEKLLSIFA
ncbi:MAG: hypothetical protein HZA01_02280 [Nitrospinae bacterium]|nr:hypothetical protein [Nitrospinota bacterium]